MAKIFGISNLPVSTIDKVLNGTQSLVPKPIYHELSHFFKNNSNKIKRHK